MVYTHGTFNTCNGCASICSSLRLYFDLMSSAVGSPVYAGRIPFATSLGRAPRYDVTSAGIAVILLIIPDKSRRSLSCNRASSESLTRRIGVGIMPGLGGIVAPFTKGREKIIAKFVMYMVVADRTSISALEATRAFN